MKYKFYFLLLLVGLSAAIAKANKNTHVVFTLNAMLLPASLWVPNKKQPVTSSINRDKNTKSTTFISTITGKWELYAGGTIAHINRAKPILNGEGVGEFVLPISADTRYYFELVTADEKHILADKLLPMEGGFNFRDLGGYQTKDKYTVKWGKIFRSDDLALLTTADLTYLSSIPLVKIIDFRSTDEINSAPDKLPHSLKQHIELSISPGNLSDWTQLNAKEVDDSMMMLNTMLVSDTAYIKQFRTMFTLLQDPSQNVPLLYHCTAGKDRTGMATALILYALGVDDETIMEDYLLSNQYILEKFTIYIEAKPELMGLFSVKKNFLQAGLDTIITEHGSIENFLTEQLKVNLAKFRQLYLY